MQQKQIFEFESWDHGKLLINRAFSGVLKSNGLTSCNAFLEMRHGEVAKELAHDRVTQRFVLHGESANLAFYLKIQHPPALKAYIKPLLRLTWPIVGVKHEWEAMSHFHQIGIPTMVPVAMGRQRRRCFLFTQALEGHQKLSQWMPQHLQHPQPDDLAAARDIIQSVAEVAKKMHDAGMHHQDFYLGHLLVTTANDLPTVYVIDLGRVRRHAHLSKRWIVKDLAQLNYSAHLIRRTDRLRFLRAYLNRRPVSSDKAIIRRVLAKSRAIARHTSKHGL